MLAIFSLLYSLIILANVKRNLWELDLQSGNVFADLGFAEPEEELTNAQLASHIRRILKRRRLAQVSAELMGIDQPMVSALLNGRLANFSSGRLMRFLTALGHDVDIVVRPIRTGPNRAYRGRIQALAG
jgi:predicted XRE-type DNA-binding protein